MNTDDEKPIEDDLPEDIDADIDGDYSVSSEGRAFTDEGEDVFDDIPENFDSDSPVFSADPAEGRNLKKLAVPALVLACAVGFGAYIMMNPGLIGGGQQTPLAEAPYYQAPDNAAAPAAPVNIDDQASLPPQPPPLEPVQEGTDVAAAPDSAGSAAAPVPSLPDAFGDPMAASPAPSTDITEGSVPSLPPPDAVVDAETAVPVAVSSSPAETPSASPSEVAPPVVAAAPVETSPPSNPSPVEITTAAPPSLPEEFPEVNSAPPTSAPMPDVTSASAVQGGEAAEGTVGQGATPQPAALAATAAPPQEVQPPVSAAPEVDTFYDSKMIVPSGPALDNGPRKVDPSLEPGSSFVVVTKTHSGQSQESLLISANRALKLGRYEAAMEMYDTLYSRNQKDPVILLGRAVAYQKAGRAESAIKMYEDLLAIDKNNKTALLNMLGLLREQYPETALRRLMILRDKYPDNAGIVAQMGLTEAGLGHPEEALRYLGIAASLEPQNAQHMFNMGIVADRKGDRAQAVKFYEQALETDAVYGGSRSIPREQIYDRLAILRRG